MGMPVSYPAGHPITPRGRVRRNQGKGSGGGGAVPSISPEGFVISSVFNSWSRIARTVAGALGSKLRRKDAVVMGFEKQAYHFCFLLCSVRGV